MNISAKNRGGTDELIPSSVAPVMEGPSRRKLQHLLSACIGLYAFLGIAALFFLLPLYVMIVTSLKIHAGNPARQHLRLSAGLDSLEALGAGVGDGLHRPQLRRHQQVGFWNSVKHP